MVLDVALSSPSVNGAAVSVRGLLVPICYLPPEAAREYALAKQRTDASLAINIETLKPEMVVADVIPNPSGRGSSGTA